MLAHSPTKDFTKIQVIQQWSQIQNQASQVKKGRHWGGGGEPSMFREKYASVSFHHLSAFGSNVQFWGSL